MSAVAMYGAAAFNLLWNAIGSFLGALFVSMLGAWLLRPRGGAMKQMLVLLPLGKLVSDLVQGIPAESFFWVKLAGAHQDSGQFQAGIGLEHQVPIVRMSLGAMKAGVRYPQSMAELAATALTRRLGPAAPTAVAAVVLTVGLVLLILRLNRAVGAWLAMEQIRRDATAIDRRPLGVRCVEIVVSDDYEGVPFAGGLRRPFVCFPRDVHEHLSPLERDAVVQHEIGHHAHADLLLFAVLGVVADVFWYVPLLRARCRAARAQAEFSADRWAVARGASGAALASALVLAAELSCARGAALGLTRGDALLEQRTLALLDGRAPLGRIRALAGWAAAVWIAAAVFWSTTFGNH